MDFSKLQVQGKPPVTKTKQTRKKKVINLREDEQPIAKASHSKRMTIGDPSLALHKKVYQFCETCKDFTTSDIIGDIVKCKVCEGSYKLEVKKKTSQFKAILEPFFLL